MELEHRFELPVGLETAWGTLTDIGKVGPCFPGSTLDSVKADEFSGSVKLKLGRKTLVYSGNAKFTKKDPTTHSAVIEAFGSEGDSSTAAMIVRATANPIGSARTAVDLVTTLSITGRSAKFGRGVMVEVGNNLVGQFADSVSKLLVGRTSGGAELIEVVNPDEVAAEIVAADAEPASLGYTPSYGKDAEPIDLLGAAGIPVAKRVIPIVAGVVALILLRKLFKPAVKRA